MILEFPVCAANVHKPRALEGNWSMTGTLHLQDDHGPAVDFGLMKSQTGHRIEAAVQPWLELLVAYPHRTRSETRSHNGVLDVRNAPDHVGHAPVCQGGTVCQGRNRHPDLFRPGIALLELEPFGFVRIAAQMANQVCRISFAIGWLHRVPHLPASVDCGGIIGVGVLGDRVLAP